MSYLPETTNKPKNEKPVKEIKKNEFIIQDIKNFSPHKLINPKQMIMINRENNLISFCQANICNEVAENPNKFETLSKFRLKFNGLCELICNYVIMQDLLGRPIVNNSRNDQYQKDNLNWFQRGDAIILGKPSENHLKKQIELPLLNTPRVKQSHILYVSSFFEKCKAYLFNIYPHDIFSYTEKVQQNDATVNRAVLEDKLKSLENGMNIKFSVFSKGLFSFQGHSMVIKKTGEKYSFFDPNYGEYPNLDINKLCDKINNAMKEYDGTHMAFLNGKEYVASLEKNNATTMSAFKESYKKIKLKDQLPETAEIKHDFLKKLM
ncbi:hypothetical protein [Legionella sainthelensi]|uniref:hypothetical protein n=1 Tax=Legionella sainthelensi TaxID=28087 RepID=UPI000E20BD04|nr:hypothetical protein [Legionella sainthelensi]